MTLGDRMGMLGVILALVALAVTVLWPDKKWIGWLSLAATVILLIVWGLLEIGRDLPSLRVQYPILSTVVVFVVGGCLLAVLWKLAVPTAVPTSTVPAKKPSLLFVAGAPLGDNGSDTWIMMLFHYGPESAYACTVNFYDSDRKNIEHEWLINNNSPPFLPHGKFDQSQKSTYVPEAGREGGTVANFNWQPLDPDRQHYSASITCRDGVFSEEWEVTRVKGVLRTRIVIKHGPEWIERNPKLDPVVFQCEDPEFVSIPLLTARPTVKTGRAVNPGWKPNHLFQFPVAILDPNGNIQITAGVVQPDGSTRTDFGCWAFLTKHLGDEDSSQR